MSGSPNLHPIVAADAAQHRADPAITTGAAMWWSPPARARARPAPWWPATWRCWPRAALCAARSPSPSPRRPPARCATACATRSAAIWNDVLGARTACRTLSAHRWQEVYSGLDAARISTIHGLCAEILRSHPAEAGVDPRFEVLDEGQGNLLRRQAVDETLAWAAEDPELVPLFELLGERGFRDTLDTLLRRRLEAAETFAALPDDVLAQWRAALASRQTESLAELLVSPDWQDAAATVQASRSAPGR